jgi:hypothetical protein
VRNWTDSDLRRCPLSRRCRGHCRHRSVRRTFDKVPPRCVRHDTQTRTALARPWRGVPTRTLAQASTRLAAAWPCALYLSRGIVRAAEVADHVVHHGGDGNSFLTGRDGRGGGNRAIRARGPCRPPGCRDAASRQRQSASGPAAATEGSTGVSERSRSPEYA